MLFLYCKAESLEKHGLVPTIAMGIGKQIIDDLFLRDYRPPDIRQLHGVVFERWTAGGLCAPSVPMIGKSSDAASPNETIPPSVRLAKVESNSDKHLGMPLPAPFTSTLIRLL
ncbi:MAG TPA: hypothetical protein VNP04_28500 [Alphaproteobacteria bacterium]|nr:hypothetical protein [Alphaproteobacteria bacterium]